MTTPPRFQDRLLDALLNEHTALTGPAYAITSEPPPALRRSRRRPALSLAAGAAVAGVAAAIVILPTSHDGRRAVGQSMPSMSSGHLAAHENAAYVVRRMLSALREDDSVVEEIVRAPDSQTGVPMLTELWSQHGNPTSLEINLDAAGAPQVATLLTRDARLTTSTTIDYATRTYSTRTYTPTPPDAPGPAPATLSSSAQQLRTAVDNGRAALVGRVTVGDQPTLEIVSHTELGTSQIYVDPHTYLTIREVEIPVGGSVGGASTITGDSRYLAATDANLAKLTPSGAIPPGFRRVR